MNTRERIILNPQEQVTIRLWAHGKSFPLRLVQRTQIIQVAATRREKDLKVSSTGNSICLASLEMLYWGKYKEEN